MAALEALVAVFVSAGRLSRAMDFGYELLFIAHDHQGAEKEQAAALTTLAEVMSRAGRHNTALTHLRTAADLLAELPDQVGQARTLIKIGHIHNHHRNHYIAKRTFHDALQLLIDHDDTLAEEVRSLLRASPNSEPGTRRRS